MRRLIGITLLVLFAVAMTVYGQSPATRNPLVGAWRVTEIDDANRPPITNPQPGLSRITTSGFNSAAFSMACAPSSASPQTSNSLLDSSKRRTALRSRR